MKIWYYLKEGQTIGPVVEERIKELILEGTLKAFDPLYRKGDSEWLRAVEHKNFAELFQDAFSAEWIILTTRRGQKVQEGPFSRQQVIQRLIQGEVSPVDYIWKPGFSEWHLLSELEEFSSVARMSYDSDKLSLATQEEVEAEEVEDVDEVTGIYETQAEDLIKDVYVQQADEPEEVAEESEVVDEPPPLPVSDEKFSAQEEFSEPVAPAEAMNETEAPVEAVARTSETGVEFSDPQLSPFWLRAYENLEKGLDFVRSEKIIQAALVALSAFICVVYLMWSSFKDQAEVSPPQVAEETKPQVQPVRSEPVKTKPPKVTKAASSVRVDVVGKKVPKLRVRTDARGEQRARVVIYNRAGEIIGQRSFYKVLTRKVKPEFTIELKGLGLTAGKYLAKVKIDKIEKDHRFTVLFGKPLKSYRRDLFVQRKRSAFFAQQERRQLQKVSSELSRWAKELSSRNTLNARKGLRRTLSARPFSQLQSKKLVFPGIWSELYGFARTLDQRAMKKSAKISVKKEMIKHRRIDKQIRSLSLWQ